MYYFTFTLFLSSSHTVFLLSQTFPSLLSSPNFTSPFIPSSFFQLRTEPWLQENTIFLLSGNFKKKRLAHLCFSSSFDGGLLLLERLLLLQFIPKKGGMNLLWDKAVEFLVSTIGKSAVDSWLEASAVDSYLLKLRVALPKARLLIERSECWRLPKYNPIDELLSQLKDSVYEAESIVDELEYQRLKNKVEKGFPGINFLRNWMRDFPKIVKGILDRLNDVYNEMEKICSSHGIPENPNQFGETARPITSTFLNISNVYGRDKEFNEVICLMGVPSSGSGKRKRVKRVNISNLHIGESSSRMDQKQNVSVLSIVGMGGIGKTTLAQKVCNDKTVESYFDLIMWVCVSDNFDLVRLTKEMIEGSATKNEKECNLTNLNELQKDLQKRLNSKKFLLVLDDVWSKDWQSLLAPMKGAHPGSVVLVTARDPECVKIPGTSIGSGGVINLEGLDDHIYWEFFKRCAFDSVAESNNINPELEVIGKEICERLKGSPLAAITIGGALRNNSGVEHWRNIKDSKMWELQKEEHDILPVLQLSYQYLPTYLKKCFSFCSLYPKDFKFTQPELTKFWIMQGFIGLQDNDKELRNQANRYFDDLARRGFFQRLGDRDQYVIHDLMHDVCLSITKDECFCLENGKQEVSLDIRHVSVFQKKLKPEEQKELSKYKKLLSLKVSPNSCCITGIETWCNVLTNIQSLSLAKCKIKKLPKNIGNLKHLQILDISGTNVETLPESFCNLYNLQYLNMSDCSEIKCFPEGFNKLANLQLFYLPFTKVSLVERFENIVKAIKLDRQVLSFKNAKIENLKIIWELSGYVRIKDLEYVPSKEAAQKAQLNNQPFINQLELEWSPFRLIGQDGEHDNDVLDGLCPHYNLKELKINRYRGRNLSPGWLKEGILPNLTVVRFSFCEVSTISHLPRFITKLFIYELSQREGCGNLENSIPNCLQNLTSLQTLTIRSCQNLVSIPAEVTKTLKSLSELNLYSCDQLQSLGGLQFLASLSKLHLGRCHKLQLLGGFQFLASLQDVYIRDCPKLDETRGRDVIGKHPSGQLKYRK
ncbi:putative disease resistance protein RGA3 isoform X2 [Carex rostrata]